jgi:DNA-binding transcriptional MerR regulator
MPKAKTEQPRKYLTRSQIGRRLGVTVNTVSRWAERGLMPPPCVKVGTFQRWTPEVFEKWLEEHTRANAR